MQKSVLKYVQTYLKAYIYFVKIISEVLNMPTTNISVLRKDLFNSIDNVIEYNEIITVNTKKGNAIIISEEDYNALLETLTLQSNPKVIKKIKDGENEDIDSMTTYNPNEEW